MTGAITDKHLTELIAKFYNISERNYNGKTYDNVLNIFDELDLEEQKRLLRGAIGLYAATASGLIHDKDLIDHGDANALLGYISKLRDEKLKSTANLTVNAIDKPPPSVKKLSLLDKPSVIMVGGVSVMFLAFIAMSAGSSDVNSMERLILLKNFADIFFVFLK